MLKNKGHPPGQRGLKPYWQRSHGRLGTPHMVNILEVGDGEKRPFPSKSLPDVPLNLGGSENLQEWVREVHQSILRKIMENRKIIRSLRQRQCLSKQRHIRERIGHFFGTTKNLKKKVVD